MRLIFIGNQSAFCLGKEAYQSNMLLEENGKRLLIDCGSDARRALNQSGFSYRDIDQVYISHLHADHSQGLDWLGLVRYFTPDTKAPVLLTHPNLVEDLWHTILKGSMSTLEGVEVDLSTFFEVQLVDEKTGFEWEEAKFSLISMIHYYNNNQLAPTYGLFITTKKQKTFISADTQFTPDYLKPYYEKADLILHDCETSKVPSGVHPHYTELVTLDPSYKKKMWLYHYNDGPLPDAEADGFGGFTKRAQVFEI